MLRLCVSGSRPEPQFNILTRHISNQPASMCLKEVKFHIEISSCLKASPAALHSNPSGVRLQSIHHLLSSPQPEPFRWYSTAPRKVPAKPADVQLANLLQAILIHEQGLRFAPSTPLPADHHCSCGNRSFFRFILDATGLRAPLHSNSNPDCTFWKLIACCCPTR